MNYLLFDDEVRLRLLPFTHTRPIADIRCGILTMRERWEVLLDAHTGTLTEEYLQELYPQNAGDKNILINGAVFATKELVEAIQLLQPGHTLIHGRTIIAACIDGALPDSGSYMTQLHAMNGSNYRDPIQRIDNLWDIFSLNDMAIREDYALVTENRVSAAIPEGVTVTGKENLFIEEGAIINAGCIINAAIGPVYIGKDAEILEGSIIRGPLALCEHAAIKMGAKIYGATTIGPGCKVGGEISNVVFFANSNKGHDGFLGNAVIGEWCNLGADTNCSNLKNNYDAVKIWDEHQNKLVKTGLTFCGLLMGDHSKCGINTMFNTGTVAAVSCNIYGAGFPDKFIPSFSWGGVEGMVTYSFDKAMDTANRMMGRRKKSLSDAERRMYQYIFEKTAIQRGVFESNNSN
ncbi:MAG: glucose-1-phosphate thymidylyltransferase [Sphingobacteriales bacterium]|nr:MAG: glucose-1-phosphate thymidylyltransferase [Sphingobacteriales bacterium]